MEQRIVELEKKVADLIEENVALRQPDRVRPRVLIESSDDDDDDNDHQ